MMLSLAAWIWFVSVAAAAPGADAGDAFLAAARDGDGHRVHLLLRQDPALVTRTDELHCTALDWAAMRGHWRLCDALLAAGSPVDNRGWDGGTVLHRACHHDRAAFVAALLDAGAAIAAANQWGLTPLHVAVRRGHRDVVALLLDRGAPLEARSSTGWTPLHVARMSGRDDLAALLCERGADPEARDATGRTPAEVADARPPAAAAPPTDLTEYEGFYELQGQPGYGFFFRREGGRLAIREFAPDLLYATGPDAFFCEQEPWPVRFQRDVAGAIAQVEVRFPLRTVLADRRPTARYVGAAACRQCHADAEHGDTYVSWLRSRHAGAYWRLATDWALCIGQQNPRYGDLADPRHDERCLLCHTTAAQDPRALFGPGFRVEEGVGCEACHGPGSDYLSAEVMGDREAFLAAGGVVPDAATCARCHRNPERFDFATWWPRIAHGRTH